MEIRKNPIPKNDIPRSFVETFELTQGLTKNLSKNIPPFSDTLRPIENEYSSGFSSPSMKATNILSQHYFNR